MPLKVQSAKTGKTYDMPWSAKEDPSDAEVDKFIASQEANTPLPVKSTFNKVKDFATKPIIPSFDTNDISLASESYPVRAGKELFNRFVSEGSSPASLAIGTATGGILKYGAPALSKAIPFLGKEIGEVLPFLNRGAKSAESSVIGSEVGKVKPVNAPRIAQDSSGSIAPVKPMVSSGPMLNDSSLAKTITDDALGKVKDVPLTKSDVVNANIVKENLSPKPVKLVSKVRPKPDGSLDLLNPDGATVNEMLSKGYEPTGEVNPDNSIKLVKKVGAVQTRPQQVKPLTAPPDSQIPSFPNGGNNGGGIPPTNVPSPVDPVAPTPKPSKQGFVTTLGTNLKTAATGLDLSAPLRQGRALMHKSEFYKAIPDMFNSLASEDGYNNLIKSIESHPNFPAAKADGLAFTDVGNDLTKREENIMGNMVEKIPGIGRLYRATGRAYTGYLNKLRFDTYNSLMSDAAKAGSKVEGKEVADLVNVLTGRGKLNVAGVNAEGAAPLLNATFFSPRFLSSRVKLLTSPISYARADPFVRKEALKSWGVLIASQATLLGLAKAAGSKVTFDPTSADFGKVKVGNSRLDTNAGLQQLFVLGSRLALGRTTSSITGKTSKLDTGKFGAPTSGGVIRDFLSSKESPLIGLLGELWTHKDFQGQPQDAKTAIIKRTTPMIAQDLYDLAKDDPKNAWLFAPALFGASLQTYGKKKK